MVKVFVCNSVFFLNIFLQFFPFPLIFVYHAVKPFFRDITFLCKCVPYIHISSHFWKCVAMWYHIYIYLFKIHFHPKRLTRQNPTQVHILAVKDSKPIFKRSIPWPCEFKCQCCQFSGDQHSFNSWANLSPVIWFDYLHIAILSPAHPFAACRLPFAVNIMQAQQSAIMKIFSSGIISLFCL